MLQNRDQLRQTYIDVWLKMQNSQSLDQMEKIIAEVIQWHPEYHTMLENPDQAIQQEFNPESGQTNPFLHMGLHIGVREQLMNDLPAGIQAIYKRLCRHQDQHEVEHKMVDCLAEAMWLAQRENTMPDMVLYLDRLKQL